MLCIIVICYCVIVYIKDMCMHSHFSKVDLGSSISPYFGENPDFGEKEKRLHAFD